MDDAEDIDKVAAEYISARGSDAVADLRERAEMASENGDELSAKAWTDIANAAERRLREQGSI
ncbi:MAG: hypothetical protein JO001_15805 [Alphaproteobacteria bacterium]|nr:hypothetical protein [Alphaproteobacteria bacterium]